MAHLGGRSVYRKEGRRVGLFVHRGGISQFRVDRRSSRYGDFWILLLQVPALGRPHQPAGSNGGDRLLHLIHIVVCERGTILHRPAARVVRAAAVSGLLCGGCNGSLEGARRETGETPSRRSARGGVKRNA